MISAPLPVGLAGLKVPLGTGRTQRLKLRPKQRAEDFAAREKAWLLDDMDQNKGALGGMRRGSVKKANRSRRSAMRSRRAKSRYMMTV